MAVLKPSDLKQERTFPYCSSFIIQGSQSRKAEAGADAEDMGEYCLLERSLLSPLSHVTQGTLTLPTDKKMPHRLANSQSDGDIFSIEGPSSQ